MPMVTLEMNSTLLRPSVPSRFRRKRSRASVETLLEQISGLTARRQQLREQGVNGSRLERNRVKLARAQRDLSYALIDRYL
jgi:hypothetical protein